MTNNLLRDSWTDLESAELRLLLNERVGRPGQYDANTLYLPLGGSSCRIALTFRESKIVAIEPGQAFDPAEWDRVSKEIDKSIRGGPIKIGRDYSFSSFRVQGSWLGKRSGVQILPSPKDAPRANIETADHPFILEFPVKVSDLWQVTNHRRMREHRKLTLLLNVLLAGHTSLQPRRPEYFWASVPRDNRPEDKWFQKVRQFLSWLLRRPQLTSGSEHEIKWVQQFFFAKLGEVVIDQLSPPTADQLEEVEPGEYYTTVGHDGRGLRVPTDLDESICCYTALSNGNRSKFDRATFWIDMASRLWNISVSASFAALVSAVESLTDRGESHQFKCPICGNLTQHEVPGPTRLFKDFFDTYAPGIALAKRRADMYSLRSGILHGSQLMQLDDDLAFGGDPPYWNESELHRELWGLMRIAVRNWLKSPSAI